MYNCWCFKATNNCTYKQLSKHQLLYIQTTLKAPTIVHTNNFKSTNNCTNKPLRKHQQLYIQTTFKAPTIEYTNHSEEQLEDGSIYEPKHVARNTKNTSSKLRVVYDYVILYHTHTHTHTYIYIYIYIVSQYLECMDMVAVYTCTLHKYLRKRGTVIYCQGDRLKEDGESRT